MTTTPAFPPPGSTRPWNGRAVANARTWYTTTHGIDTCARCGLPITGDWHLGHKLDRQAYPELVWNPDNWQAEHRRCSSSSGATQGNRRRPQTRMMKADARFFSPPPATPAPAARTHTPPEGMWPEPSDPANFTVPWIAGLLGDMPETAGLPRYMTAVHPEAVGSYGEKATEWAEKEMGIRLRWFQRLGLARQLEFRADGSLCWRYVVDSTPRRVGKSIWLKVAACWRVDHAELLGEPQTVLFTGKDLPICKEIHRSAWVWAAARGWRVHRGMGNEELEKSDGSRWLVRSQNGVYGYPAGLACCDESWDVPDAVIREGLQPALMNRTSPQLLLTSTAHTKATALMRRRIRDGLGGLDGGGDSLLLLWCSSQDADPADPAAWRESSPFWDGERAVLVADAWRHVVAGQVVVDPLERDAVEGFKAQYLNLWPRLDVAAGVSWGERVAARLPAAAVPVWSGVLVGGLESEPDGSGWGAAVSDGRSVECVELPRLGEALAWLSAHSPSRVLMHESVGKQLGDTDLEIVKVSVSDARAATAVLRDAAGGLSWSGVLGEQVGRVRVSVAGGVESIDAARSGGAVAGVKAAAWALWSARTAPVELSAVF